MPGFQSKRCSESLTSLLLLIGPFLACWVFFWLMPLIGGVELAMEDSAQTVLNQSDDSRPGDLQNFKRILEDRKFIRSLENTSIFVGSSVFITLSLGFFLASVIRSLNTSIRPIFLFLLIVPSLALPGTLATLFYLFFHGKSGALNQFLIIPLGFEPINWMMDTDWILPCLIAQAVWRWTGLITLLIYCGLRTIPKWQFDVARIEGASPWTVIRTILYPGVRHLLLFGGIFLGVDGVASFSGAYNLLGGSGGVLDAGLLFVTYAYQVAFPGGGGRFDLPLASAMCVTVAMLTTFFGLFILKICKKRDATL